MSEGWHNCFQDLLENYLSSHYSFLTGLQNENVEIKTRQMRLGKKKKTKKIDPTRSPTCRAVAYPPSNEDKRLKKSNYNKIAIDKCFCLFLKYMYII